MCIVTSTELKKNLSYYLQLSEKEEIHITKNKKVIAIIKNPKSNAFEDFLKLRGCLKGADNGLSDEDMIGEEIMKRCGY